MPQPRFLPLAIVARGRDDPETVKLTISIAIQSTAGLKEESSLGAIPEMLYCNIVTGFQLLRSRRVPA